MSLSFSAIAETPLATPSPTASNPKTPPRRTHTAVADAKSEPDVR